MDTRLYVVFSKNGFYLTLFPEKTTKHGHEVTRNGCGTQASIVATDGRGTWAPPSQGCLLQSTGTGTSLSNHVPLSNLTSLSNHNYLSSHTSLSKYTSLSSHTSSNLISLSSHTFLSCHTSLFNHTCLSS